MEKLNRKPEAIAEYQIVARTDPKLPAKDDLQRLR
jgi:hypothetical protein